MPADEIRRITREFAAADGAAAYGRVGLSTQGFGSICQWAIHCLNILSGNFDREGGVLFTEPAADVVGRAILGRGHYDLWRSRVRGIPEFGGELPASTMREEIETPGEGQIRRGAHGRRQPRALHARRRAASGRRSAGVDFMAAVDIYLNETTRHAARGAAPYDDAGARPVRPRVPLLRGAQHREVVTARVREARGRHARLGDLPRDHPAHGSTAGQEEADGQGAQGEGRTQREPGDHRHHAPAHRPPYDDARAALEARRCRPRAAASRRCRRGCRPRTSRSTSRRTW